MTAVQQAEQRIDVDFFLPDVCGNFVIIILLINLTEESANDILVEQRPNFRGLPRSMYIKNIPTIQETSLTETGYHRGGYLPKEFVSVHSNDWIVEGKIHQYDLPERPVGGWLQS